MTTFVLGAGASRGAGYPLATTMASELLQWMKDTTHESGSYAAQYPATARYLEEHFGPAHNIESFVTRIQALIDEYENGTVEQRKTRVVTANQYGVFKNAVRAFFAEIQQGTALQSPTYRDFAREIVAPGDSIITFNYDVSLDRELHLAEKFEVGDGYGFPIENLPTGSATTILKLHGSTSWLALLFGGLTSGVSQFSPGHTLGDRPVIPKNELSFLGYADAIDPRFVRGGAALPVMIFPTQTKDFYFVANTGFEYRPFWDQLWRQAEASLRSSSRIVIVGYSLNSVDERACKLLLNAPRKDAEIVVASGEGEGTGSTTWVVRQFKKESYAKAVPARELLFQNWVTSVVNGSAPS